MIIGNSQRRSQLLGLIRPKIHFLSYRIKLYLLIKRATWRIEQLVSFGLFCGNRIILHNIKIYIRIQDHFYFYIITTLNERSSIPFDHIIKIIWQVMLIIHQATSLQCSYFWYYLGVSSMKGIFIRPVKIFSGEWS